MISYDMTLVYDISDMREFVIRYEIEFVKCSDMMWVIVASAFRCFRGHSVWSRRCAAGVVCNAPHANNRCGATVVDGYSLDSECVYFSERWAGFASMGR